MTKKEMIQAIQLLEAASFLECKKMQKYYGKESTLHRQPGSIRIDIRVALSRSIYVDPIGA